MMITTTRTSTCTAVLVLASILLLWVDPTNGAPALRRAAGHLHRGASQGGGVPVRRGLKQRQRAGLGERQKLSACDSTFRRVRGPTAGRTTGSCNAACRGDRLRCKLRTCPMEEGGDKGAGTRRRADKSEKRHPDVPEGEGQPGPSGVRVRVLQEQEVGDPPVHRRVQRREEAPATKTTSNTSGAPVQPVQTPARFDGTTGPSSAAAAATAAAGYRCTDAPPARPDSFGPTQQAQRSAVQARIRHDDEPYDEPASRPCRRPRKRRPVQPVPPGARPAAELAGRLRPDRIAPV